MSQRTRRGLIILGILIVPALLALLFTFEVIRIRYPTDMSSSPAIDYQEGPRIAPPELAVPLQGESVISQEFPVNPVPADAASVQRGEVLYDLQCELCHGVSGHGDGPLAGYFSRTPEDLVGEKTVAEFDGSVYLVIQNGFGQMPGLAENLTVQEMWDVINYVRTFQEIGE